MLCEQADVEYALQIDFTNEPDPTVAAYIAAADAHLKRWLNRNVEAADYPDRLLVPTNTVLPLDDWPVQELTITEAGNVLVGGTDYYVEMAVGGPLVRRTHPDGYWMRWDARVGQLSVSARLGYEPADVPEDLVRACALHVAAMFRSAASRLPQTGGGALPAGPITAQTVIDHRVEFDTGMTPDLVASTFRTSGAMELAGPHRRLTSAMPVVEHVAPGAFTP